MSFDWNLSSDEENTFDQWAESDWKEAAQQVPSAAAIRRPDADKDDDSSSSDEDDAATRHKTSFSGIAFSNEFEEEGEDDVDWEDASDGKAEATPTSETPELATDTNAASALATLRPITLDWTTNDKEKESSKNKVKRIARKRYRFEHLTPDLQYLLANLEKSHLLGLTAHAIYASHQCSQEESLHVAHSMIPLAWVRAPTSAPSMNDLRSFCNFFFHLVHPWRHQSADMVARMPRHWKRGKKSTDKHKNSKQEAQETSDLFLVGGKSIQYRTPKYCEFLADRTTTAPTGSTAPQPPRHDFHSHDHVHLFIAMTRSLDWRVRYVVALDPCRRDLDMDHPLFVAMSTRNVFQKLWSQSKRNGGDRKRPAKRVKTDENSDTVGLETEKSSDASSYATFEKLVSLLGPSMANGEPPVCWVEILCQEAPNNTRKTINSSKGGKLHWVHLDPSRELIDAPDAVETILYAAREGVPFANAKKKRHISYALAAEHLSMTDGTFKLRLVDVTPRYASSFVETLKVRGVVRGKQGPMQDKERPDLWWAATLKSVNIASHARRQDLKSKGKTESDAITLDLDIDGGADNDKKPAAADSYKEVDEHEQKQLQESRQNEPIPTSKTAFKTNPVYTLPSLLNSNEVLKPDAKKRVCGVFKGELVFRRSEVETVFPARKWLYKGRKVKDSELSKPIKRIKARNRGPSKSFKALKSYGVGEANDGSEETRAKILDAASNPLGDGMENLYASWQTNAWAPDPVGPNDPIPSNEHNNIELALLNPGLVHIDERHVAKVAKKLGIPYVPCLLGFEGHGGNRTPTIRGIVVHHHNEELLREAHEEMAGHFLQEEHENKQRAILLRWKRLMVGVLTKDRLDRAYG